MMYADKPTIGRITDLPRIGMTFDETHGYLKRVVGELVAKGCSVQIFGAAAFRRQDYLPMRCKPRSGQVQFSPGPPRCPPMLEPRGGGGVGWKFTEMGIDVAETLKVERRDCVIIDPLEIWIPSATGEKKDMLIGAMYNWWYGLAKQYRFAVIMVRR